MNQPELGMEIAKFRKAKGMTQSELAEQCELTIRTIQRIESGTVTPRGYTIKALSAALGHDFQSDMLINTSSWKQLFWQTIYLSILDLFNLKTYTMRKISILVLVLILTASGLLFIVPDSGAQESNTPLVFSSSSSVKDLSQKEALERIREIIRKAKYHTRSLEIVASYAQNSSYNFGTYIIIAELISSFGHSTQPEVEIANVAFFANKKCDLMNDIAPLIFLNNKATSDIVKLAKEAGTAQGEKEIARIQDEINKLKLSAKYKTLDEAYKGQ